MFFGPWVFTGGGGGVVLAPGYFLWCSFCGVVVNALDFRSQGPVPHSLSTRVYKSSTGDILPGVTL